MAETWFYSRQGAPTGPVDESTLRDLIKVGLVTRESLVWKEGMGAWAPAGQFVDLFGGPPPPPKKAPPPLPQYPVPERMPFRSAPPSISPGPTLVRPADVTKAAVAAIAFPVVIVVASIFEAMSQKAPEPEMPDSFVGLAVLGFLGFLIVSAGQITGGIGALTAKGWGQTALVASSAAQIAVFVLLCLVALGIRSKISGPEVLLTFGLNGYVIKTVLSGESAAWFKALGHRRT